MYYKLYNKHMQYGKKKDCISVLTQFMTQHNMVQGYFLAWHIHANHGYSSIAIELKINLLLRKKQNDGM